MAPDTASVFGSNRFPFQTGGDPTKRLFLRQRRISDGVAEHDTHAAVGLFVTWAFSEQTGSVLGT